MEIDLATLQKLFERARVESELGQLIGHSFTVSVDVYGDELHIDVRDSDAWVDIITISIPTAKRTTLHF